MIVLPLAAGELARTAASRRFDPWIWVAFTASALPLAIFYPLLRASGRYAQRHGLLHADFGYYSFLLRDGHAMLLILLVALGTHAMFLRAGTDAAAAPAARRFRAHEVVAIAGFLALPAGVFALTKLLGLPFADRYVLSGCLGVSMLVALVVDAMPERDTLAALVIAGLVIWAGGSYILRDRMSIPAAEPEERFLAEHAKQGLPIVVGDLDALFRLPHEEPRLAPRVVYLADAALDYRYAGSDTSDRILTDLRPWLPTHVEPFCVYVAETPAFYVYGDHLNIDWLTHALVDGNIATEVVGVNGGRLLLLAHGGAATGVCR